jgi:hypothetical protein
MRPRILVLALVLASMVFGLCLASGCSEGTYCVETLNVGITTETSATLCGKLTYEQEAEVGFAFWETQNFLHQENPTIFTLPGTISGEQNFYYDVGNLQPGNSYSYKAWAKASGKNKIYGDTVSFNTEAEERISPTVTTGEASNVTYQAATLHGAVVSMGTASSLTVEFEVRTTGSGTTIYSGLETLQTAGEFSLVVSGLTPETIYYFKAVAKDLSLGLEGSGAESDFTTATGAELTILSSQLITDGATFARVTGQAQNTGTVPLGYAQIAVYFKDASGAILYGQHAIEKFNLALGEIWTWEVTYLGTDFSNVASHEATVVLATT